MVGVVGGGEGGRRSSGIRQTQTGVGRHSSSSTIRPTNDQLALELASKIQQQEKMKKTISDLDMVTRPPLESSRRSRGERCPSPGSDGRTDVFQADTAPVRESEPLEKMSEPWQCQ